MLHFHREEGLSEIVGFILLLAAVVIVIALWLTFGIPAQGRAGEIEHMNQVKDRFVEYKINVDSLWSNRQCGTAIGTSFTLGTAGGATTGSVSLIPILSPVKTAATLALNQRDEYLTVAQDSYFMVNTGGYNETGIVTSPLTIPLTTVPRYFFINITSPSIEERKGVYLRPGAGPAWGAWVNMTPVFTTSWRHNISIDNQGHIYNFSEWTESRRNHTDVTITTKKGETTLVTDMIIYRDISPSTSYFVDLMDPLYGISSDLASSSSVTASRSDATVITNYLVNYSYWPGQTSQIWPMGSLEYRAQNEYWIPQTYYYQLGGIFLQQNEGTTVKIPPSISISLTAEGIPLVKINEILLSGYDLFEGSGPVRVTSSVSDITDTLLVSGNNTRFVNVSIRAANNGAAEMWNRTFREIAANANLLPSMYTTNTSGTEAFLNLSPDRNMYGIRLSLNRVTVNTALQSMAPPAG